MGYRYLPYGGLLVLFCLHGLSAQAEAQHAWGLGRLLEATWASHPAVIGKHAGVQAAQGDLAGARWQRYPTPTVEAGLGSDGAHTTLLRLDQPLWNAGRISAGVDAAGRRLAAADAAVLEVRQELGLKVIAAWAEAKRQQARAAYVASGVTEHRKLLQMIERRVQQEVSPAVDRNFAESRLLQVLNDLSAAQQALGNALTQLSQLAGQPVVLADGTSADAGPISREVALAQALANSPTLKRLVAEEEAADADVASKRSGLWPQLSLRVESATGEAASRRALLVLTAQPGAGLSASAGVAAAVARREAIRLSREAAARDIQEQIAIDWDDRQASIARLSHARLSKAMSAQVFESYTRQYVAGRKTWIDVLNAVREATQAELVLADFQAQSEAAAERLRLRTGEWLGSAGNAPAGTALP
jgi:adhesin transport system outer membrane protein